MIISARRTRMMKRKTFVMGALTGAAMGSVAGVLLAPKSGKETRKDISGMMNDIKNDVMDEVKKMGIITKSKYNKMVSSILAGYREAQKITPDQAKEIAGILDESFFRIQEAAKKEME